MDSSSSHTIGAAARDVTPPGSRRSRRRRRPTGEPPPLPRHLESTGVGWMVAALGLVILTLLVFMAGRYGRGVSFAVADNRVVEALANLRTPWLTSFMRGLNGLLGSLWTVKILAWATLIVLVVYKRFRHLVIALISFQVLSLAVVGLSAAARRPRPFGVELEGPGPAGRCRRGRSPSWPPPWSRCCTRLVPEGRWRQPGKWVATGLVTAARPGPDVPGRRRPHRRARRGGPRGHHPAAGLPLVRAQRGLPGQPTGGAAAPTWTSAGPAARPSGAPWTTSSGLDVERGQAVRAGRARPAPPRCGSRSSRRPAPATCSASCTPAATCARTAGTSWAGSCCTAGWRTRSRSTPSAGWSSRRTTPCTSCTWPGCPAPTLRLRRAHPRAGVPAGHRVLRRRRRAGRGRGRRAGDRRRPRHHPQAVGRRAGPPRHQAGQPAGPRRPHAADRRGLRRVPAQPLAPGRRPGQHDAVPGPARPAPSWSTSGPCGSSPSRRSPRRSPPPAGWPCPPSSATCCGPRAATCTPSSCACCPSAAPADLHPALEPAAGRARAPSWSCWSWRHRAPGVRRPGDGDRSRPASLYTRTSAATTWSRCG